MKSLTVLLAGALALCSAFAETNLKRIGTPDLGGEQRYLTFVSTDKPIYREGEMVYMRSVLLHAQDRTPFATNTSCYFTVLGPKGEKVFTGYSDLQDGVSGFAWEVPKGQSGGEYTVSVIYPGVGAPPSERKFDVRAYRAPRLRTQIKFLRDGFGPGDKAVATLSATRAEGGFPSGAQVTITARVDGAEVHRATSRIDAKGKCVARFKLPDSIERGEGTLAFSIQDGGTVETATKTIPILLQTLDLTFFPEGGTFVAGLANRIYVEARTPAQKPADFAGVIINSKGKKVTKLMTEHEGRGRVTFVPEKGETYSLKITKPSGIKKTFPLPELKDSGVSLQAGADRFGSDKPVVLSVASAAAEKLVVTLARREQEVARAEIETEAGKAQEIELDALVGIDGVLIATVWDSKGNPLAERLVYREPSQSLKVSVSADKERYVPGGKVTMKIKTTDEKGNPVGGMVGMTATDDSVLEMIEKREQTPRLPVMVLLEKNVKDLADAHVYLDAKNEKAPVALDLLLGTQGWRRFAFVDVPKFVEAHGVKSQEVLALRGVSWGDKVALAGAIDPDAVVLEEGEDRVLQAVQKGAKAEAPKPKAVPARAAPGDAPPEVAAAEPSPAVVAPADGKIVAGRASEIDRRRQLNQLAKGPEMKREFADALQGNIAEKMRMDVAGDMDRREAAVRIVVREYAHQLRPNRKPTDRVDFTETVYWHAGVKTNDSTGEAEISFFLSDSVTAFRVFADAFDKRGALGSAQTEVEAVQPFYLEPKLPLEVTSGDIVRAPISFVNETENALAQETTITTDKSITSSEIPQMVLNPGERVRRTTELKIGDVAGEFDFTVHGKANGIEDKATRQLKVVPRGFPVEIGYGGLLKPDSGLEFPVSIPKTYVRGSAKTNIAIHPTPLASLTQALQRLIREPSGCFEQTSSSTYPLVMAQQYFMSHQDVDPAIIEKSAGILERGYQRLIGFECKGDGYEWFGADPAHEALSAYGLLEFTDMAKVRHVDPEMLDRTRGYLLSARDGKGGFTRKRRALHTWIVDKDCSNGYITWSMLEGGQKPDTLRPEIESSIEAGLKSKNSYVVALAANIALLGGNESGARNLMQMLAETQGETGVVKGGTTSIVGSRGSALDIETTGLAMLAWLRDESFTPQVEESMKWMVEQCKGGRYGSTQSTVLALRAIVEYDKARSTPKAPGILQLYVDGKKAGSAVEFDDKTKGAITLTDISELLEPGDHLVEIHMTGGSPMPYAFAVDFHDEKPEPSDKCNLTFGVKLNDSSLTEGEVTEAEVTITNKTDKALPTPIAIVGVPGGLEVRHDQLKELVKSGKIATYEVIGRDVVIYWRELGAEQTLKFPISFVAEIPGTYTGPASRAYEYYADEFKQWVNPIKLEIAPRKN